MATQAAIRRALKALDAEATDLLARYQGQGKLPAWLGHYRFTKSGGEHFSIVWQRRATVLDAARRGQPPTVEGHRPLLSAIIDNPKRLDPAARHLMRLWLAIAKTRRASGADDRAQARRVESYLKAHPPSLDRRAGNIAERNRAAQDRLAPLMAQARAEAAAIRKADPRAKKIAERVKASLGLEQSVRTVQRWLAE